MNKLFNKWKKGALLISVAMAFPFVMNAQTHVNTVAAQPAKASIWYFGDHAGIDFSQGTPVALTNGAMQSFEGVAAMSDNTGRLLFYSNGGDFPYTGGVWNRNHQMMPNGVMTGRGGCNSSAQAALIVPQPRSSSVYYLFTTDCMENNAVGGLRYNIVDMNADGGLGDVVSANNKLISPTDESLTAIQHANGNDYWIVTHKYHTDSFYVYHLAPTGIVGVVKTKIGNVTPDYAGTLKASTNGQKLVYSGLNWTAVYDFDARTGAISHYIDLNTPSYSSAFSPNCQYLYVANGSGKTVYQFDMYSSHPESTKIGVGTTASTGFGGLALGPDQKIYLSRFVSSQYVAVITDPDKRGTDCNYIDNGIYLNGKMCKGSLPNYPNNMLGGCTDYPVENGDNSTANLIKISIDYFNAHHVNISWGSGISGQNVVLHREAGTTTWSSMVVNDNMATLEDLKAGTNYEIRVLPVLVDNPNYEPIADHLFADDMAKTASTEDAGIASVTTSSDLEFDLYPNPSNGIANIALNIGDSKSDITVKVTDVQGKVINEVRYADISGYSRYQLPTTELADGIYNVQVATASTSTTKKLVIVR